jgi:uncharacterized OB-fold protein
VTDRPLPALTELNRSFWTAGASGRLHVQRCGRCERLVHPPALLCPDDHSDDLQPVPVSGRGTVETFTVNQHTWFPGLPAPYVIAYVALEEDPRARLLTNLVGVEPDAVSVGMPVHVVFEHHQIDGEDIHVPLFEPAGG